MKASKPAPIRRRATGRARMLLSAQEEQNQNLARELHDVVSQKLAALAMEIDTLRLNPPRSRRELGRRLERLSANVAHLGNTMHEISRQLHPAILDDLGLREALHGECLAFSDLYGNPVTFVAEQVPESLPPAIALHVFRIAQESLRNAGKHARSSPVSIRLSGANGTIMLNIQDQGPGFDARKGRGRGLGLLSIKERAKLLHGTLRLHSQPGKGTTVTLRVPLKGDRGR
ncbi:MAG TPA: sensor histidine kinase [Bryobacteraceae bacterium]|nr:sensor histidine kinase [Bryobacteraceae bacterium]